MAKRFDTKAAGYAFGTEEVEDAILLHAFLISERIKLTPQYLKPHAIAAMKRRFIELGDAMLESNLIILNNELERRNHQRIIFRETHSSNYSTFKGEEKALMRQEKWNMIKLMTEDELNDFIALMRINSSNLRQREDIAIISEESEISLLRKEVARLTRRVSELEVFVGMKKK